MTRLIRVYEFEKLTTYGDDLGRIISKSELEVLYKFNDRFQNQYFTGIQNGIKVKNFVGVIQIGSLTIEILPKTDREPDKNRFEYETNSLRWQRALLKMLATCKKVKVESVSEAELKRRNYSILELYFEMYVSELEHLLRMGLIKKYRKEAGNVMALKGRLDFSKQIQQNLLHKERFYTHHQTYDRDHLLHQILFKGMKILDGFTINGNLKDSLARLFLNYPEVSELKVNKNHFDKIIVSRKTQPYTQAIQIAKMLILNYSPDISGGEENMIALLFDMNKLWEEYIYRILLKTEQTDFDIYEQRSKHFWQTKSIRPDIVIKRKNSEEVFVIDTKWKLVDPGEPSDDDLKQMYAYNMYWNAAKSMLLYPGAENQQESFGKFHKGRATDNLCKLGFIHVLDSQGVLDMSIGRKILDKMRD